MGKILWRGKTMNDFLKTHNLVLIHNHAIYFKELDDTAFGVLAEDTNYMIRNIGKRSKISIEEIETNLQLLEKIIEDANKRTEEVNKTFSL